MDNYQGRNDSAHQLKMTRAGALLFLSLMLAYLLTASGRIDSGDGMIIFAVGQSLFEDLNVTVAPPDLNRVVLDPQGRPLGKLADLGIEDGYSIRGRGGYYYSPTGIGQSLFLLPFLALGKLAASMKLFGPPEWTMQFVTSMFLNPLVSACSGLLVCLIGRRLSFPPALSVALAIIYAFGTMTWVYAKSFFSDPLVTLSLLLSFYSLLSYKDNQRGAWLWIGGASLGLAALTKPGSLINAPIMVAYLIFLSRAEPRRVFLGRLLSFIIPLMIGVAGIMGYNWWRFESPLDTGYRNMGWTSPFFEGLYGLIASPGKGYLLYNPISLGAIAGTFFFWRRHKPELWVIIGIIVVNLGFLAKYTHWHGGGVWGPRLLLPITPFLILPLGSLLENMTRKRLLNLLLSALIALSIVVQISGVSVSYARFLQRVYDLSVDQYYRRVTFEISYSPIIGQWLEVREVVGNLRDPASRALISEMAFEKDPDMSEGRAMEVLSTNLPDFWFVYLYFVRSSL
jgi:hypothetical protein